MNNLSDGSEKPGSTRNRLVQSALFALLWITVFSVVVPFNPNMPAATLDASWEVGLNQAMEQGLQFGKDIIFTYGPYSFIETHLYSPATDSLMIWTALFLAFAFCILFSRLFMRCGWYVLVTLIILFASNLYQLAGLFYFYQLMVGAYCLFHVGRTDQEESKPILQYGLLAIIFAPLGLLPLVKGALLPSSILVTTVSILYCLSIKDYRSMCVILVTSIASPILFWLLSGQDIDNLAAYFHYVFLFSSGYTEAMAWFAPDRLWEPVLYLISSLLLLLVVVIYKENIAKKVCILLLLSAFLFLILKTGFVRHDFHALIATGFLLFAAIFVYVLYGKTGIGLYGLIDVSAFACFMSFLAALYIFSSYQKITPKSIAGSVIAAYSSAWQGISSRVVDAGKLQATFVSKNRVINNERSYPYMQGTTDVYSVSQASLIASGNVWNPRPVFQSYAAYTPELMQINQRHLLGEHAPDNIIFTVEPIDKRVPSLEDGLGWPVIWSRYELAGFSKRNWLHLKKRAEEAPIVMGGMIRQMHRFGEPVQVPNSMDATFVKIIMKRSLFGALSNILYKTSDLVLLTKSVAGVVTMHKLIPEMAESGFLLSPMIETTVDFGQMYASGHLLSNKKVAEFVVCGIDGKGVTTKNTQWNSEMEVIFTEADMSKVATKEQVYSYD